MKSPARDGESDGTVGTPVSHASPGSPATATEGLGTVGSTDMPRPYDPGPTPGRRPAGSVGRP